MERWVRRGEGRRVDDSAAEVAVAERIANGEDGGEHQRIDWLVLRETVLAIDLDAKAAPVKITAARKKTFSDGIGSAVGEKPGADGNRRQDGLVDADAPVDDGVAVDT